jgi:hypothetical protein
MTDRGVVYACSHKRWLAETLVSARSCAAQMPDLRRQLFVTEPLYAEAKTHIDKIFPELFVLPAAVHAHRPRFEATLKTDLAEAIFIDGDTFFVSPVYELFDILADFDIAAALAPQYFSPKAIGLKVYDLLPAVSAALPEWNTGVIVARVDDGFRAMVETWSELFQKAQKVGFFMDQASFRSAVIKSGLRIATLPNNYNFRANIENNLAQAVKILHAHGDLEKIAGYINEKTSMRVYIPKPEEIHGYSPRPVLLGD